MDAFTQTPFSGNPAGVVILDEYLSDEDMQLIAREVNHSETAFVVRSPERFNQNQCAIFALRWFTPEMEINVSGHATLAASKVLHDAYGINNDCIIYDTSFGEIVTRKEGNAIVLNLPMDDYEPQDPSEQLLWYLGINNFERSVYSKKLKKLIIEVDDEKTITRLKPDYDKLRKIDLDFDLGGIGVTCKGAENGEYDFSSRYFNPWIGVNEDSITGSVHTVLALYWSRELKKKHLLARQCSRRPGNLILDVLDNGRVEITGHAFIVLEGRIRML